MRSGTNKRKPSQVMPKIGKVTPKYIRLCKDSSKSRWKRSDSGSEESEQAMPYEAMDKSRQTRPLSSNIGPGCTRSMADGNNPGQDIP